jgi:thioesterase domain-containing protein
LIATKEKAVSPYHPLIVPLREHGTLPPLFWIHSLGGWIREFQSISPFLDQNRPVFGIRARGLEPSEKLVPTIEERVREYADAIKTVQKEGPYHLLGFSAGGRYAFELACQLQKKGEVINYLGIIDISAPSPQTKLFSLKKGKGSHTVIAAGYHCYRFLRNRLKPDTGSLFYSLFVKGARFSSQGILYLTDAKLLLVSEPDDTTVLGDETEKWIAATYFKEQYPLVRNQIRAFSKHRSRIFSGDITLFSTGSDSEFFPGDPSRGWNGFITGKTLVIAIPGNHETVFNETFGPVLAKKIEESLKRIGTHE